MSVARATMLGLVAGAIACGDGKPSFDPTPYTVKLLDDVRIGSDSTQANFQRAAAMLAPLAHPAAQATLTVALTSTCFPFEKWETNPPPSGQNWPADCDAFDRNFEVLVGGPGDTRPRIELIRAITPFGGPLTVTADVTDFLNALDETRTFEVDITTYSDGAGKVSGSAGGWNVSASIAVTPGDAPRPIVRVVPLYDDTMNAAAPPVVLPFALTENASDVRVEYRVTGHGGASPDASCIGPADEFCRRTHTISIDGAVQEELEPWRTNCDELCTVAHFSGSAGSFDYCTENPCGAMQSVRASRANWCPGSETPPFTWTPETWRAAGQHSFGFGIAPIAGNWRATAAVYVYR